MTRVCVLGHGLVVSVVLLIILMLVCTESLFFLLLSMSSRKYGWRSASSAEMRRLGDNSRILCRRSMQDCGTLLISCESSFLNLFFIISASDMPALTEVFMMSFVASISSSSSRDGSPTRSVITLARAFEFTTLKSWLFFPR